MLELSRRYFINGTNGRISYNGNVICFSIELPNKNNQRRISCIPEGEYELMEVDSVKFGNVYMLKDVPKRSGILIHPANSAKKELLGCIAPVTRLIDVGKGVDSRKAMEKLFKAIKENNITKIKIIS